jgi:5'(3')-deoxyribonucleotidase
MTKPFVFGVDLDGVVADYTAGFREVVAAELGRDLATLPLERSWDFEEWGITAEEFERLHQFAVTDVRMLADLPVIAGAADALWRLSDAGVWIRVVTHRLYANWGHATAIADTVTWLDANHVPYRDICFLGAKPEVEADCYVDDAPHNITALRADDNDVIVFDQPYNRAFDGPRATDWDEVEMLVLEMVAARRGAVEVQLPGLDPGTERLSRRLGR